jgi:hypothetical protein
MNVNFSTEQICYKLLQVVFCVATPCSDVIGYRRFGRQHWRWRYYGRPKWWYRTTSIYSITTQKTWTGIFTTVETSNLACFGYLLERKRRRPQPRNHKFHFLRMASVEVRAHKVGRTNLDTSVSVCVLEVAQREVLELIWNILRSSSVIFLCYYWPNIVTGLRFSLILRFFFLVCYAM